LKTLLDKSQLDQVIQKLGSAIHAAHNDMKDVVLVGIQQGGAMIGAQIVSALQQLNNGQSVPYGELDITFYRDDIRKEIISPDKMNMHFAVENKTVVLIDDVLFTGRTIKAALDALLDYGRPARVELCVLIDRKEYRQFPIQADYVGKTVATNKSDKVKLVNGEVVLLPAS
jgi:pyrimidine operon attenuation protein / uracil phosphoribosyltransferase